MFDSILNAFRAPDIRRRILFVLGTLIVFRALAHVPVPGADPTKLAAFFNGNALFGLLDLFSGGGLTNFSVVALGVNPELDEQPEPVRILLEPLHPSVRARPRSLEGRLGGIEGGDLFGDLHRQVLVEQRQQQVVLAAEVVVHRALGEPRLVGDLVERRGVEAAAGIDPCRRLEQLRAGAGPPPAAVELTARHGTVCDRCHSTNILSSTYTLTYGSRSRPIRTEGVAT